jgi:hypothetical protein
MIAGGVEDSKDNAGVAFNAVEELAGKRWVRMRRKPQ